MQANQLFQAMQISACLRIIVEKKCKFHLMKEHLSHMVEQLLDGAESASPCEDSESGDPLSLWWLGYKAALRDVLKLLATEQQGQT